ncbi:Nucleotide-binding, alpha-beta plait [Ostreococcus tauri]|uniref:Nucleotide-binding, alpha-beta plait n=1 Tax=Ostreococcus tauri TaxID=70448 RepID=Q01EK0_OSTTA|nr:Nucleotide-binding, alpha-beta plait [Ostreococcus tauri]CAL52253.2 Nucleotide-binding, alpha-beta plait [Ostreococcus tauri]|eukprot:XP_003074982.1 Nucleotide-binding, alpha-beta plait [Ostreococcus tauri]
MTTVKQQGSHTLYVNNLSEKISKQELRMALYSVFSSFGKILDIVAARTYRLRGQAWIVYDTMDEAQRAFEGLQNFPFYDKPLKIAFANLSSDVILRREGEQISRVASARVVRRAENQERERMRRTMMAGVLLSHEEGADCDVSASKERKCILVQGLPAATTTHMLTLLFQQFLGFKSANMSAKEIGIGQVEFDTPAQASAALNGLQGFRLNAAHSIVLSFL